MLPPDRGPKPSAPQSRTARGASFSGNLLAVPTPLPDNDEQEPVGEKESAAEAPGPLREGLTSPEPAVEDRPASVKDPDTEAGGGIATQSRPNRDRAPGTIRIDSRAGEPLWEAYIEAKTLDPFLSYRQFASGVVLDGLATHRRRQKRS
jgi:hypothetical protein